MTFREFMKENGNEVKTTFWEDFFDSRAGFDRHCLEFLCKWKQDSLVSSSYIWILFSNISINWFII